MYDMPRGLCCVCLALLSGMIGPTTVLGASHYAQNMAHYNLPECSFYPSLSVNSYGEMKGDGTATMHKMNDEDNEEYTFTMYEVSAFSHIPLKYRYENCWLYGTYYDVVSGNHDPGYAFIYSLETGGRDTDVQTHIQYANAPGSDTENY